MPQPKQGIILLEGTQWFFHQGQSLKSKKNRNKTIKIPLPVSPTDIEKLIESKHIAKGWQTTKTIQQNINSTETFHFIARRVAFMHTTDPSLLTSVASK